MPAIFLSYRREDTKAYAGRLFDRLSQHFGTGRVFMDVENGIPLGADAINAMYRAAATADAMVVLIGRRWLSCTGDDGSRRIDDPDDWVRREIETALRRGILVLPVLVDGGTVPAESELPEEIRGLAHRQACEITDTRWNYDVAQIIGIIESRRRVRWRWLFVAAGVVPFVVGASFVGWIWSGAIKTIGSPFEEPTKTPQTLPPPEPHSSDPPGTKLTVDCFIGIQIGIVPLVRTPKKAVHPDALETLMGGRHRVLATVVEKSPWGPVRWYRLQYNGKMGWIENTPFISQRDGTCD